MIKEVIKRDGKKEKFDARKIRFAVLRAALEIVTRKEAEDITEKTLPVILEILASYRKGALSIESIQDIVEEALMRKDFGQVAKAYILYRKYRQDLRLTKEKLGIKDELKLSLNAVSVLKERYLLKDKNRKVTETPLGLFRRVADFIAKAERNFSASDEAIYREKFYEKLKSQEFLPNSPTLMNAGTPLGQLAACFVLPVGDSIEEIFSSLKAMALIHQSGGGTGFSFSQLRPKNDIVHSTKGVASGPLSFMDIFNAATGVVVQGGRRRGANMAILKVNHPDIVEFIEAKLEEGRLDNFNISVGITDEFMHALRTNGEIRLINPRTKACTNKMKARTLFSLITFCAYKCADPGLIYLDHVNRAHPLRKMGEIEATNPCGEIPLLAYECCNLASVNLSKFVTAKKVDWKKLGQTVKLGVRFLDNVIEVNKYPLKEIEEITKKNRKIGLGIMGFADMLIKLGIPYNSKEAILFTRQLMRFIRKVSLESSMELAKERGVFANWKHSSYAARNIKLRNATLNSIAPTGSISIIANCSSGIEPLFALSYTRNVLQGMKLFELNPLIEEVARQEGVYSKALINSISGQPSIQNLKGIPSVLKRIFVTALDMSAIDHLKIQAAFQESTDNAVSKTINLPAQATIDDVKNIYLKAYELKLKGITIYRYGSKKEQVLYATPLKTLESSEQVSVSSEYSGGCFSQLCPL